MAREPSTGLRTRVDELEATVRGLTQELVEADERIRQLEAALEDRGRDQPAGEAATDGGPEDDETSDGSESDAGSDADGLDDIIVA